MCCDSPTIEAPDTTALANATAEGSKEMVQLGHDQLDFAKDQYAQNKPIADQIVKSQLDQMAETSRQGKDYYDYMVANQRPVETALNAEAMKSGEEQAQEAAAGKAMADVRQGTTAQQNQAIRQGMRYGYSPAKIAAELGVNAGTNALSQVTAANEARNKEKSMGWAKKLDVAGLYRGLPGASQGAYGVALNSGNSANSNAAMPGNNYMNGMAQGSSTVGAGRQMAINGLGNVLNAQTSIWNTQMSQPSKLQDYAAIAGAGAQMYAASHPDYKQNIECIGTHHCGVPLYSFEYKPEYQDRWGHGVQIGVMATEVVEVMPEAVKEDEDGYTVVNYSMLGGMQ